MTEFSIKIQGIEKVLANLTALEQRAQRVTIELARDTALVLQAEADEVFQSAPDTRSGGTVYGGKTWKSLTEAYLKANPRREGGQIYRDYGDLLNSLTVGGAGNILTSDSESITFGTALPKAGKLNKDREFLFVTDRMVDQVAALWENHIING